MGPTATGKTAQAMALVQKWPMEIVSVDSAMVYRGMDVGTGKPSPTQLQQAPHHLIDVCQPTEHYSAAQFREDARACIDAIHKRGKIPLLVGGTMLYFKALKHGIAAMPASSPEVRARLNHLQAQQGLQALYERLQKCDPQASTTIHNNDAQRILRALEVYEQTGQPISSFWGLSYNLSQDYPLWEMALVPDTRSQLAGRIEKRFQDMLQQGIIKETEHLIHHHQLDMSFPAMRCVGYRQIWHYLQGEYDYATMRYKAIVATRQLAKRQITWLRRWDNLTVFDSFSEQLDSQINAYLQKRLNG
jgi:tRNA dimethylallyltransferase